MANIFAPTREEYGDGTVEAKDRVSFVQTSFANSISEAALEAIAPAMDLTNITRLLMQVITGSRDVTAIQLRFGTPNADGNIVSGYLDLFDSDFLTDSEPLDLNTLAATDVGVAEVKTPATGYAQVWMRSTVAPGEMTVQVNGFYAR